MPLNPKQKEAVEYLEGPLLVLAGPGTGKTQLLSEKVAYILKNTDTNPENILCLTFTESGASNMRERLKTIVGKDAARVNIGTYHAFGSDILAQYKNYSDSYDRKLDNAIDEVEQFKIVKDIQEHLPATDILRGDSVKDIVDIISSAKAANLSAEELDQIADQNIADSKVLSDVISPLLQNLVPYKFEPSLKGAYEPIYEILKDHDHDPVILKTIDRNIKAIAADLKKAMVEATSLGKIKPLSDWKDNYFEKDDKGNYRLRDRIKNKKLKSFAKIMAKYNDYLKENGLFDYDDMIMEAGHALATDRGFKLTMSERYQFILLDEFQDTNPSQLEIIKQLTDYEKPMIMAVGDDDQAIYEFQGASATNLTTFQEHYGAHVIGLVENYRSTQEILDFSHQIIAQADNRFADKELIAHKENPSNSCILRHEFLSSDQEYSFVADQISDLIKSGTPQTDIAIIAPKHKYIFPLLPFLKSRPGINIAYEKRDNLLEDEKIHELITISKFVSEIAANNSPETSILEILSYPFWELPILEVIKTVNRAKAHKKSTLEFLSESDNEEIKVVANFLGNLVAKSFETPLEIFFDYLIGTAELNGFTSPFLKYYTKSENYEAYELYENLATLRGKLSKKYTEKAPKLSDLINLVNDYESAGYPIQSSSPYRDSENAIQILSAHKAKGLEFEYVFIIAADNAAWGKSKGNNNLLFLPNNLAQIRHTGATEGERIRLLYVAATRSKKHLIITNSIKDFNEKSPERVSYLEEFLDENKNLISPFLPTKAVTCHYQEVLPDHKTDNLKNWLNRYLIPNPDMRAIYKERLENYRLSASALTSFIDVVYAGPQTFFERQVLHAPDGPKTEALVFGTLIHSTFQQITDKHISDEEAIKFFLSELEKQEIEPETLARLRERGPSDLLISLKAFGETLRAENSKAEVNLGVEKLSIAGVPVTGIIDHINIDDTNKTIEIYDFKTGGYHKEQWESKPTLYKYMLQLGFYKLLLNASPTYSKYKIETAHILFVTPDNDGEVHDKVYKFTQGSEDELVALIKSVYNEVISLNFIDDPEIFQPADSKKGIKDIKKFVELMLAKSINI